MQPMRLPIRRLLKAMSLVRPAGETSQYFTSFPEDIQMFAVSLNTTIGQTALQGEIAHHKDRPLQIDDLELLFAGLSPLRDGFAEFGQLGSFSFNAASPQFNAETPPLTEVVGFKRMNYTQTDFALTRVFGPTFGANQAVLLFERAWNHVSDMPSKDELRFDGPATVVSGNAALGGPGPFRQADRTGREFPRCRFVWLPVGRPTRLQ